MKKFLENELEKLKNVVENDEISQKNKLYNLLKSDIFCLFENYFDIDRNDIFLNIKNNEFGIEINIKCIAKRVKEYGYFEE